MAIKNSVDQRHPFNLSIVTAVLTSACKLEKIKCYSVLSAYFFVLSAHFFYKT